MCLKSRDAAFFAKFENDVETERHFFRVSPGNLRDKWLAEATFLTEFTSTSRETKRKSARPRKVHYSTGRRYRQPIHSQVCVPNPESIRTIPAEISGRKSEFIANPDDAFFQRAYDGGEGRSHGGEPRSEGQRAPGK